MFEIKRMEMSIETVQEINPSEISPMVRQFNRGLMVQFINADLLNRGNLDVRKSYVFYDDLHTFELATETLPTENQLNWLYHMTNIRYWSKGC